MNKQADHRTFIARLAKEEADKNRLLLSEAIEALSDALKTGTSEQNVLLGAVREAARRV